MKKNHPTNKQNPNEKGRRERQIYGTKIIVGVSKRNSVKQKNSQHLHQHEHNPLIVNNYPHNKGIRKLQFRINMYVSSYTFFAEKRKLGNELLN